MPTTKKRKKNAKYKIIAYFITLLALITVLGIASYYFVDKYIFNEAFVNKLENRIENTDTNTIFSPDKSDCLNVLFGVCEDKKLESLLLVRFDPIHKEILCVPVSTEIYSKVNAKTGSINDFYKRDGLKGICPAVENALDVDIQRYIFMDKVALNYLFEKLGGVYYTVPFDISYTEEGTKQVIEYKVNDIKRALDGDDFRKIIAYPFPESRKMERQAIIGGISVELINQSIKSRDSILKDIDTYYKEFIEMCQTDFSEQDYATRKKALIWLVYNSDKPASFSVPKGKWNINAQYEISEEYKKELKEYLYLNE